MTDAATTTPPEMSAILLKAGRDAMPWPARRALAAAVRDSLAGGKNAGDALAALQLLADDPRPEVRQEAAEALVYLPEPEFPKLAARLSSDGNFFVRNAAERALDRRRKGVRDAERLRRNLCQVRSELTSIEKFHGRLAAQRARKLADRQFELLVRQTAHDIRSVISPLKAGCFKVVGQFNSPMPDLTTCREAVSEMCNRVAFLERFVNDMEEYARAAPAKRERERVSDMVRQALGIVCENLDDGGPSSGVSVKVVVPEGIGIEVSRHQIVMVLIHVLKNAFEALGEPSGRMRRRKRLEVRAAASGDHVMITVSDNGPGICVEDLGALREFVPGRTTKKERGTGFGLPTAHRYISAHGGTLAIDSVERRGTTVTITLPIETEEETE